jgi:hypothetical protein
MNGELTKLSETRWRYAAGRRVYYIRQAKAPNEDTQEPGLYQIDGGRDNPHWAKAESVEQVADELARTPLSPQDSSVPS